MIKIDYVERPECHIILWDFSARIQCVYMQQECLIKIETFNDRKGKYLGFRNKKHQRQDKKW